MIIITSKRDGFRRCGEAHAATPTEWPDDRWTQDELEILGAEPMLVVLQGETGEPAIPPSSAAEKIAFINKMSILEALLPLAEGESRKTVLEAIEARRKELGG